MSPDFPLPIGQQYGPRPDHHDGRANDFEARLLGRWQQTFNDRWHGQLGVDGVYDGATRAAAYAVQDAAGLDPTGLINFYTWHAVWNADVPVPRGTT